ncbi:unnamed protein product [Adineta steineri]|uniref:Uncharacterized protein n=2 Tax=Adineta steineri TaxID=433720 RepID=A0A813RIP2_9BILA|nr:unnamed protein product [Adineta steineri]
MEVQPVKAKCPCCNKVETLTICEHCNCTKCTNCNEKHINDMRQSVKTILDELQNTSPNDLKGCVLYKRINFELFNEVFFVLVSVHDAFKNIKSEIYNQFQNIRQQHDSLLLTKQMDILKQLELHEQNLLT